MSNTQPHGEAGKGDKQRPTDQTKYAVNYDTIFRNKKSPTDIISQQKVTDEKTADLSVKR